MLSPEQKARRDAKRAEMTHEERQTAALEQINDQLLEVISRLNAIDMNTRHRTDPFGKNPLR